MRWLSLAIIPVFLSGCVTSGITTEHDSFTGANIKKALIHIYPNLNSVINIYLSRPESSSSQVTLAVFVNSPLFRFKSDKAFGLKGDEKVTWFDRKPGVDETKDQNGVTAEFVPVDLTVLKSIALSKTIAIQANDVSQSVNAKFSENDIKALRDFVN